MDYRRMKLFSWKKGYDFGDHRPAVFRRVTARRVRKQEKRALGRTLRDELKTAFEASWERNEAAYRYLDSPKGEAPPCPRP